MTTIKNLAFKGGGVLGIAYAGAVEILEEKKILDTVERVTGTSAGAVIAALLSLRYNAADIKTIVNKTNFKSYEDGWNPLRMIWKFGLYKGGTFLNWMHDQITAKGLKKNATFTDFKNAGMRDLYVFATDLNQKCLKEFSFRSTPSAQVAEAVRASMSVPLFFQAFQFSNGIPDDHIYVDGGIVYNFPITLFDEVGENKETLGLFLENVHKKPMASELKHGQLVTYVKDLFDTMGDAQEFDFDKDPSEKERTVIIDNLAISYTDFGIPDEKKQGLFESGKKYTREFLDRRTDLV